MPVAAPLIAGRYVPASLLSESPRTRVILCRKDSPAEQVVLKIKRHRTLFDVPASAFYGTSTQFFGPQTPADLILHEASALGCLNHPAVPRLLEVGNHAGLPFFVAEYKPGRTLHELVAVEPDSSRLAPVVARDILGCLAHAHSLGIYHRDISLKNILIEEQGEQASAALIDFELSVIRGIGTPGRVGSRRYRIPARLLGNNLLDGVHAPLMTDEELRRADRYALGVVLFHLLTKEWPPLDTDADARDRLAQELTARASRGQASRELWALIGELLLLNPRSADSTEAMAIAAVPPSGAQADSPSMLAATAQVWSRQGQGAAAAAIWARLLAADAPLEASALAHIVDGALACAEGGIAVAAALRADAIERVAHPGAGSVSAWLDRTAGRLVLLLAARPEDPDLLLPLAVACTHLGLRRILAPSTPLYAAHGPAAALLFHMGQEVGRAGLSQLPPASRLDPTIGLHLALCEWCCGDTLAGDILLRLALASGLLAKDEQVARFGSHLPWDEQRVPTPTVLIGLVLLAARQPDLCQQLLDSPGITLPQMLPLTDVERQQLAACLRSSTGTPAT